LSHQTHLVLSFTENKQALDAAGRRALARVLFLYGIPGKYVKLLSDMCKNNIAADTVGNEVSSWFRIIGVKQYCAHSPLIWVILTDYGLRSTEKAL